MATVDLEIPRYVIAKRTDQEQQGVTDQHYDEVFNYLLGLVDSDTRKFEDGLIDVCYSWSSHDIFDLITQIILTDESVVHLKGHMLHAVKNVLARGFGQFSLLDLVNQLIFVHKDATEQLLNRLFAEYSLNDCFRALFYLLRFLESGLPQTDLGAKIDSLAERIIKDEERDQLIDDWGIFSVYENVTPQMSQLAKIIKRGDGWSKFAFGCRVFLKKRFAALAHYLAAFEQKEAELTHDSMERRRSVDQKVRERKDQKARKVARLMDIIHEEQERQRRDEENRLEAVRQQELARQVAARQAELERQVAKARVAAAAAAAFAALQAEAQRKAEEAEAGRKREQERQRQEQARQLEQQTGGNWYPRFPRIADTSCSMM